jgi:lysozyme family protein
LSGSGGITEAVLVAVGRSDPAELIARLCDERLAFLKGLKTWPVFGAGWGRRVAEVKAAALDMAARAAISAPAGDASTQTHSPRLAQKPAPARTAVRGGVVGLIAATGAAISQWVRPPGASVAMVLAVAVVLAFAGWLVWRRQRRRHD